MNLFKNVEKFLQNGTTKKRGLRRRDFNFGWLNKFRLFIFILFFASFFTFKQLMLQWK